MLTDFNKTVVLASSSPRRRALLEQVGCPFVVRPSDCDETVDPETDAETTVRILSRRKADAAVGTLLDGEVAVAADTVVSLGGAVLGKPKDKADAARMLRMLSGKTHEVYSGVTVTDGKRFLTDAVKTSVTMRALSDAEIDAYIATGEPLDKAGAYGVQGYAAVFVEKIDGEYFNVVGLPLCRLDSMLHELTSEN